MNAKVLKLAGAAIAVGADGLIVEVHHDPDRALSDGPQSIYPEQFEELIAEMRQIAPIVKRTVPQPLAVAAANIATPRTCPSLSADFTLRA